MAKSKFRLLPKTGPHKEGGVIYRAGDVVESEINLVQSFPGKFVQVEGNADDLESSRPQRLVEHHTPYDIPETERHPATAEFEPTEEPIEGEEEETGEETEEEGAEPSHKRRRSRRHR